MPRDFTHSRDDLESTATGRFDPGDFARFRAAQHNSRLILLRAVLDRVTGQDTGPLPPVAQAWQLLVAAENRNRAAVRRLLNHPEIGLWATYTLRRLNTGLRTHVPLWQDIGQLHTIAATAATLTGLPFRLTIPLRQGNATLPTLGMATFPVSAEWETARAQHDANGTTVSAAGRVVTIGGAGWQPMRRLTVSAAGRALTVWLDDLDPYRGFAAPLPPTPLAETSALEWHARLAQAWSLLVRHHPDDAGAVAETLDVLVPFGRAANRYRPASSSCADSYGCAGLALPDQPATLAAMLVHEQRHNALNALLTRTDLHTDDWTERYYAPWRDDPRPVGGLLQGTHAFLGVANFWRRQRLVCRAAEAPAAQFEFALRHGQVHAAAHTLVNAPALTEDGRRFAAAMLATVHSWADEVATVPAEIAALARRALTDHRATWRLRHLQPAPDALTPGPPGLTQPTTEDHITEDRTAGGLPIGGLDTDAPNIIRPTTTGLTVDGGLATDAAGRVGPATTGRTTGGLATDAPNIIRPTTAGPTVGDDLTTDTAGPIRPATGSPPIVAVGADDPGDHSGTGLAVVRAGVDRTIEARARTHLTQLRLGEPDRFGALLGAPGTVEQRFAGATAADLLLVAGDFAGACAAYRARLMARPGEVSAWIGLGLALDALGEPAGRVLLTRPEAIRTRLDQGEDAEKAMAALGLEPVDAAVRPRGQTGVDVS